MNKWIARSKTEPKSLGRYLVNKDGRTNIGHYIQTEIMGFGWINDDSLTINPDYWMPLPTLPDVAASTKREVPKDGRTYLCWNKDIGWAFYTWIVVAYGYCNDEFSFYKVSGKDISSVSKSTDVVRYMDEKGNWVEL